MSYFKDNIDAMEPYVPGEQPDAAAEVVKADLETLEATYPDAFARECHITAGPCLAGFTEGGV